MGKEELKELIKTIVKEVMNETTEFTVKMTVGELKNRKMILTPEQEYMYILRQISERLNDYFGGNEDEEIQQILEELGDEKYINIIYLYYKDGMTLEQISFHYGVEVGTIKRNKKKLILKINELIEIK